MLLRSLFIQRAQSLKPDFAVTDENAPAVTEICWRLDGLPLAIELAAARVRLFSPQQLLTRLTNRLQFLTVGARDLPERQQTLRGAIAWSYDLLAESEKRLFRRLAVFVSGCSLEAAAAVAGDCWSNEADSTELSLSPELPRTRAGESPIDVLDGLESLAAQSLLRQEEGTDGEPRFTMLETIREYGLECLRETGEEASVRQRHARFFLELAEKAELDLLGMKQQAWLDRLEADHDNIRAALDGSAACGEAETGLRLAGALWGFWAPRGHLSEGRERLAHLLALPGATGPTAARARGLACAGILAHVQGDYPAARQLLEECLPIQRELGETWRIGQALTVLGFVAQFQGEFAEAEELQRQGLAIWRTLGHQAGIAWSLNSLADSARDRGDYPAARDYYEQSLTLARETGDLWGATFTLDGLGVLARFEGDLNLARSYFEESLAVGRRMNNRQGVAHALTGLGQLAHSQGQDAPAQALLEESLFLGEELGDREVIAVCLEGLAVVASSRGEFERAARLFGAAESRRQTLGTWIRPADRAEYESHWDTVRSTLGQDKATAVREEGRRMSLEQVTAA